MQRALPDARQLISIGDIADYIGVTRPAIYMWAAEAEAAEQQDAANAP